MNIDNEMEPQFEFPLLNELLINSFMDKLANKDDMRERFLFQEELRRLCIKGADSMYGEISSSGVSIRCNDYQELINSLQKYFGVTPIRGHNPIAHDTEPLYYSDLSDLILQVNKKFGANTLVITERGIEITNTQEIERRIEITKLRNLLLSIIWKKILEDTENDLIYWSDTHKGIAKIYKENAQA